VTPHAELVRRRACGSGAPAHRSAAHLCSAIVTTSGPKIERRLPATLDTADPAGEPVTIIQPSA